MRWINGTRLDDRIIRCDWDCGFVGKITHFLERIRVEHIELTCSLESELTFISLCFIRTPSRNQDNIDKLSGGDPSLDDK